MKFLITGACGFVGASLAENLLEKIPGAQVFGIDNLCRRGSSGNWSRLRDLGVTLFHGDIRIQNDLSGLPETDWVIDAAAEPSVLAGIGNTGSSQRLMENNLLGTVNTLEYCKRTRAGLILLSTSRVYSIEALSKIPIREGEHRFELDLNSLGEVPGLSSKGITETFSSRPPISLYGASKLASELLALEYAWAFDLPVFVNRCGVLAGAGQFGRVDQGIFSFWLHSWNERLPLEYIGFGGSGLQVRDCLHSSDLADLLIRQITRGQPPKGANVINVSGGPQNSISLSELSKWCKDRFGLHEVGKNPDPRPFDVPHIVLDSSLAEHTWDWSPTRDLESILSEIADFAEKNPEWTRQCNDQ